LSAPITEVIKSKALGLISTYILLPNYLEDAAQRFKSIIDSGIEVIIKTKLKLIVTLLLRINSILALLSRNR
jgi:hypothetical protein